jgi:hypothetical protein
MAKKETIDEFIARGGKIKTIKPLEPLDDRYIRHTSRFYLKTGKLLFNRKKTK